MTTPSTLPGVLSLTLLRGDSYTWEETLEVNTGTDAAPVWVAKDVSGYNWRAQVRATPDTDDIMAVVAVTFLTDGTDGRLRLHLSATESRKLVPGRAAFDLEATSKTDPEDVHTYLSGTWKIKADTTR